MKRRDFLQLLAATGITANIPLVTPHAHASSSLDQYLVVVNAQGGWDPTSLCDPKGLNQAYTDQSDRHEGSTNSVALDATKKYGAIQWSAIPEDASNNDDDLIRMEQQFDDFFNTHGEQLTVINGIDTQTNNHDTGSRFVWSGYDETGYPSLAAYYAAAVSPNLPMAFISNGGYDFTDSLVAKARAINADFISQIADPNHYNDDGGFLYRSSDRSIDLYDQVKAAQASRIQRQLDGETLPKKRQQLNQLFGVRSEDNNLADLSVQLDDIENNVIPDEHWNTDRANSLKSQAQVVVAAFKANLAASANLNTGGFDTHGNHDANAYPILGDLLEGVHYLKMALDYAGIADKTTIVIGSDFGRTPYYNSGNGKDHWPVTSMMVMSGDSTGGKVFGESSSDFNALAVNEATGEADSSGLILEPGHVNQALRELLGVESADIAEHYPLPTNRFSIFS